MESPRSPAREKDDAVRPRGRSGASLGWLDRAIPDAGELSTDELRRARVLVGLIGVGLITATVAGGTRIIAVGPSLAAFAGLGAGMLATLLGVAYHRGLPRAQAGDAVLLFSTVVIFGASVAEGGLHAQATPWFAILPLIANFVGGRLRALAAWGLAAACLVVLYVAELSGQIPPGAEPLSLLAVRLGGLIGLVTYVAVGTHLYELSRREADAERAQLDRLRSEWISVVSHELRTPLTSMQGALKLLDEGVTGELPERARGVVQLADRNCARLNRLVSDVLDIERLEAGALQLRLTEVDLGQLVHDAIETNAGLARENQVSLVIEPAADVASVRADPDRIVQVLDNLISNATKFSPTGSTVRARVRAEGEGVRVEVRDEGAGIPEQFRGRVFERFAQAQTSQSRERGGSGLGLSICKGLVERHGGEIGFRNEAEGGSTFYFVLPRRGPSSSSSTWVE